MSDIHSLHGKRKKVGSFQATDSLLLLSCGLVLDENLWVEIFKRCPTKSLGRFRCVCKSWNSFISSPFFIKLHFTFKASATPCNLKPYLHVTFDNCFFDHCHTDLLDKCYAICRPPLDDDDDDDNNVEHFRRQELHFMLKAPHESPRKKFSFVGVIHGVICTHYLWAPKNSPSLNSIILWNPAIHKYVALPRLRYLRLDRAYTSIGFGYDASKNDFKVVMIMPIMPCSMKPITIWYYVYSIRKGSWSPRSLALESNMWHFVGPVRSGCFVNGTIHWIQYVQRTYWIISSSIYRTENSKDEYSVLMFDCESEEFRRMLIPKCVVQSTNRVELLEYAGMLAALVLRGNNWGKGGRMDLWVMEEYGVSSSWKKLYTIPAEGDIIIHDPSFEKMAPYGPNSQWNKTRDDGCWGCWASFNQILRGRVYDESMFLMDHPKAQSCTKEEILV